MYKYYMSYFTYAKHIFERLGFRNPMKLLGDNYPWFDKEKFNKMFHGKIIKNQYGGGDKKAYIIYKNKKFNFSRVEDKDGYLYYAIYQEQDESNEMCIMITIEKEIKSCDIHTLSYDEKCFSNKKDKINEKDKKNKDVVKWSGRDLLQIAFKIIDEVKDNYDVKTITLTDNSQKFCRMGKSLDLGLMLILLTGDTWYGKHGFRPKDKIDRKIYDRNKEIIKKTKLKDVKYLKSMLKESLDKYYAKNKDFQEEIIKTYDEYCKLNKRLKSFLSFLFEYYNITCEMFYDFYKDLAYKIGVVSLYGKSFVKYI